MASSLLVARVLWQRRRLRRRERWTEAQLRAHPPAADSRRATKFASARSPFYRRFHHDLERAPLDQLPPLTKATLMDTFDEAVTDRALRLTTCRPISRPTAARSSSAAGAG
jgi:phenylacetate-CoA ligase